MRINVPNVIGPGDFTSDLTETEHPAYSASTTYAEADQVISVHKVYESIAGGNLGNPPASSPTHWIEIGASNLYKPYDGNPDDQSEATGSMRYTFAVPALSDSVSLIRLEATSVRVVVRDNGSPRQVVYDETRQIIDTSGVVDWFTYFTYVPAYAPDVLFLDLPAYGGYEIELTIDAGGGIAKVGQILVGRTRTIGKATGAEVSFRSFSTREFDAYGRPQIVKRATRRRVSYQIVAPADDTERVQRIVADLDVTPAVYFAGPETGGKGTTVFGIFPTLRSPVTAGGWVFATLEIEGL